MGDHLRASGPGTPHCRVPARYDRQGRAPPAAPPLGPRSVFPHLSRRSPMKRQLGRFMGLLAALVLGGSALVLPAAASPAPSPTVVGGTRAAQGEFPFMVRLSMGCGGAL